MRLIPVLGNQKQENLSEYEVSLVYRAGSATAGVTERNPN